jgi:predicted Zn-ribbon and HTH transcriptional regulator
MASEPIPLETAKSEFEKKVAEFEYSGISVNDVKIGSEGTTLTLQQGNITSMITFVWGAEEDIGPFVTIKPQQGEAVNLDLTPLSPPVVDTKGTGRQIDVSNLSWLNKEAFAGIISAAGMKETPPEQEPETQPGEGSGAPQQQAQSPAVELDAKTVPAPKPQGQPGEALIERAIALGLMPKSVSSDWLKEEDSYTVTVQKGKDSFNLVVGGTSPEDAKKKAKELTKADKVMNVSKQAKKEMESVDQKVDTQMKCKTCGYIGAEPSFHRDEIKGYEYTCPKCDSHDVMDAPSEVNHSRMRVKPSGVEEHCDTKQECADCGYIGSECEFAQGTILGEPSEEPECPKCGSSNIEDIQEESMENKNISLFRFIIREGKRIKIPLGEAKKKGKEPNKVVTQKPLTFKWDKKVKEGMGEGEFSKKFFITMANAIKRFPEQISKEQLISTMIMVFQQENPRFDADRFRAFIEK